LTNCLQRGAFTFTSDIQSRAELRGEETTMAWTPAKYVAKDYSSLKDLQGITNDQIAVHLTLYNGYVTRSNKLN